MYDLTKITGADLGAAARRHHHSFTVSHVSTTDHRQTDSPVWHRSPDTRPVEVKAYTLPLRRSSF